MPSERSRGVPGAIRRNVLPEALLLPEAVLDFVREVRMAERRDFTPYQTVTSGLPLAAEVELTEAGGVLRVLLVRKYALVGRQLARPARCPGPVALRPRQALRWQVSYRIRCYEIPATGSMPSTSAAGRARWKSSWAGPRAGPVNVPGCAEFPGCRGGSRRRDPQGR